MFHKVQIKLTLFCTIITGLVILIMTCAYLYVTEKNLTVTKLASFQNDTTTIISNLETQTIITYEWLTKLESGNQYMIWIEDNGTSLLHSNKTNEVQNELYGELKQYTQNIITVPALQSFSSFHKEFTFDSLKYGKYYASFANIQKTKGILQVFILYPLSILHSQIMQQRILFLSIDLIALLFFLVFYWYFVKRLLLPIEESRKKQTAFIASASHELRTPLTVILSTVDAMENCEQTLQRNLISILRVESMRMTRLLQDMLLLAGNDSHTFTFEMAYEDLDTILLNSYEAFLQMAKEKNLQLTVHLQDTTWPKYYCDKIRIGQTIDILIHNAISYTASGGMIDVIGKYEDKTFILKVSDNGIGIADSDKTHIFERFYRADMARSRKDHFGLGLSIASEIIKAHHGHITVEDTSGGGSTFIIFLPFHALEHGRKAAKSHGTCDEI